MKRYHKLLTCLIAMSIIFGCSQAKAAQPRFRIIKSSNVKLFAQPNGESAPISTLKRWQEVLLLTIQNQWVKVQTKRGLEGWVMRKFLGMKPSKAAMHIISYTKKSAAGISLKIVKFDLQSGQLQLIPVSAKGMNYDSGTYTDQSFVSMAKGAKALAAINGCFFDKHTKKPIGDIVIHEELLLNGGGWAYFGIQGDLSSSWGKDNPIQSRVGWTGFQMGITCLPLLIKDGVVLIHTKEDLINAGFHDPHIFRRMPRSALAETKDGQLLFVVSGNTSMPNFARALKAIGIVNALGLDGGASTALYYQGSVKYAPGRKLTTILAVVRGSYKPFQNQLTPPPVEKPTVSKPSFPPPATPPESKPTNSDICKAIEQQPLVCASCKIIIQALRDQGDENIARCYEKFCARCTSND